MIDADADADTNDFEENQSISNSDTNINGSGRSEKVIFQVRKVKVTLTELRYFTFLVLGVALLWPWNCYLAASEYFDQRFVPNSKLSNNYSSTMMTISTLTSTCCSYILSQRQHGVDYKYRVKMGQILIIIVFAILGMSCVIFTQVNYIIYFIFVMISVFLNSSATAISQNGVMALVNILGPIFANGVMVGQAFSGVLPSFTMIISVLAANKTPIKDKEKENVDKNYGAMIYFLTSCFVSALSLFLIWLVDYLDEIKEEEETSFEPISMWDNNQDQAQLQLQPQLEPGENLEQQQQHVPFRYLWSKLKLIALTIFFTFSITLIFPVFASSVESVNNINKNIFTPLAFLIWSVGDLLARLLCAWSFFIIASPRKLIILSILRLIFIPFFFMCNFKNNKSHAIIQSDVIYILLQFLFGLTNGQLCSSSFMNVSRFVDGENEQKAAGGFTTVFLSIGLAFGSLFSYLFTYLVNRN
ncbi:hypothetical protein PACTADRAFT_43713 [Pachysolen tannophilus NRRL Y-2460]|uniref:Nucleoside transporter family protein n=1 Tax=Pachysolen tannophilus NRRL Y-2460 TaxID=669874 RepID=A0A1E4TSC0_PACTA|nr:hypothetical protein PACTADRAFT_43713 [Pachysolen tannophilus NRRL Y-2460]